MDRGPASTQACHQRGLTALGTRSSTVWTWAGSAHVRPDVVKLGIDLHEGIDNVWIEM